MEKYAALIADIKNSRELVENERIECQKKLYELINKLNAILSDSINLKLVFSAGDSIQGLFYDVKGALYCYYLIKNFLYPYEIRCGIGVGSVYKIDFENINDSNSMDGDSYHKASFALELCKEEDYNLLVNTNNLNNDVLINQLSHSIMVLERNQTKKQREINVMINMMNPALSGMFLPEEKSEEYANLIEMFLPKNISSYQLSAEYQKKLIFEPKKENGRGNISNEKRIFLKDPISPHLHLQISQILGISRESVRQTVENGWMNEIRRLEILVLLNANI